MRVLVSWIGVALVAAVMALFRLLVAVRSIKAGFMGVTGCHNSGGNSINPALFELYLAHDYSFFIG
jgi:hypothetical protein